MNLAPDRFILQRFAAEVFSSCGLSLLPMRRNPLLVASLCLLFGSSAWADTQGVRDPKTGEIFYLEDDRRHIFAVDARGKLLWRREVIRAGDGFSTGFTLCQPDDGSYAERHLDVFVAVAGKGLEEGTIDKRNGDFEWGAPPKSIKDPKTNVMYCLETDQCHVSATSPGGMLLWRCEVLSPKDHIGHESDTYVAEIFLHPTDIPVELNATTDTYIGLSIRIKGGWGDGVIDKKTGAVTLGSEFF